MTLRQLARFIVDGYYDGSPGDESYQAAIDQVYKTLLQDLEHGPYCSYAKVPIDTI